MNRPDALMFTFAFTAYLLGFLGFITHIALRRETPGRIATLLMMIGAVPHTIAFILRWTAQGHYPLSSMYEYMGLMAWMVVLGLIYFNYRYKNHKIGVIISPVAVMLLVTASLLPSDINKQLMPALQSVWLAIHVSLAAFGSGAFLISYAAASLYLMSIPSGEQTQVRSARQREWVLFFLFWIAIPVVIAALLYVIGWLPFPVRSIEEANIRGQGDQVLTAFGIGSRINPLLWGRWAVGLGIGMIAGIVLRFLFQRGTRVSEKSFGYNTQFFAVHVIGLLVSALVVGYLIQGSFIALTPKSYLKIFEFFGPVLVLSWITIPVLYYLLVVIRSGRKPGSGWIERLSLPRPVLEEISYSAVAIGYPLYTIGALFAGAIWAEQAWGTWWSWDPKEVGALIIWLFYTGFLHARHNLKWKGERAAVLIILGMVMLFVSFFGNYFFGGLHSFEVT